MFNNNMFPFNNFGQQMPQQQMPNMPQNYPWMPSNTNTNVNSIQSQNQQQNFDFIPVNDFEDIKNFYVKPLGRYWFRFQNEPIIALKFADEVGRVDTKYFKISEFYPQKSETIDAEQFAPVSVIQELRNKIEELENKMNSFKGVNNNVESIEQIPQPSAAPAVQYVERTESATARK